MTIISNHIMMSVEGGVELKDYTFYKDGIAFAIFPENKEVDLVEGNFIHDADSDEKFVVLKVLNDEVYLGSTENE